MRELKAQGSARDPRQLIYRIDPRPHARAVPVRLNLQLVDTTYRIASLRFDSAPSAWVFFPLEAMAVTGKSKSGEAGRKVLIARADARAAKLAPIVAELRRGGVTSWYGIARELNRRGIPTATGRGIWEPAQVRRVMERLK
jgi:hypothetical protein